MPVGLNEFKKRFGKKPVDEITPEQRYNACLRAVGPKLRAGKDRGEKVATDAIAAVQKCVAKKDWLAAADLLDEAASQISIDAARATKLRQDLAAQAERAFAVATGKLPTILKGVHDAVEAEIAADNYGEAASQLEDFKELVDDHLNKLAAWNRQETELDGNAEQMEVRRRAKGLGTPELTQAASVFYPQRKTLTAAIRAGDLGAADEAWKTLKVTRDKLLSKPNDSAPDKLKELYESRLAAAKKKLDDWLPLVGSPDPLLAMHQASLGTLQTNKDDAANFYDEAKYQEALQSLDLAILATTRLTAAAKAQDLALADPINQFSKDVRGAISAGKVPPSVPATIDTQALLKSYADRLKARADEKYVEATRLPAAFVPDFQTIWREMQAHPQPPTPAPPQAPESPEAVEYQRLIANPDRAKLTKALNARGADLAVFRAQPGAAKLLDDMVKAIGSKADSQEKRDFVQAAMKARFGLKEVTGGADGKGMSTKALPRMYKLFGMLPPEHTTDNELITSVERLKVNDTSTHSASNKKIVLKAGKTGSDGGNFDDTTLHEIAHGVDSKFKFMENNGKARKFGGWRTETRDSVKKVASDDLAFYSYFEKKDVARPLLVKYLDLAFSGSNPKTLQAQFATAKNPQVADPAELEKHPAVKHAAAGQNAAKDDDDKKRDLTIAARKLITDREPLKSMLSTIVEAIAFGKPANEAIGQLLGSLTFAGQVPADDVWAEMAVHPAIDFASNVGLKNGTSGLWDQGDSGAGRYAVNGRVYQEAYTNDWVSYLLSARSAKVCDYQFRHRMEWFAECYSRFFLNTLSPNHPVAPWLTEQKNAARKGT